MKLVRFLQTFLDPARAVSTPTAPRYAAVEAGPLCVHRLEERCVLAAGPLMSAVTADIKDDSPGVAESPLPQTVPPLVTVPGNQATVEGSPLIFSAATGRLIRIDDPDIGANPLVVDLTAFESLGGAPPNITLASTAGLTSITGNGTNVLRLEGTLADINAALSYLTFYSVDDGDFIVSVTATDAANSEADSASFQVQAENVSPTFDLTGFIRDGVVYLTVFIDDPGREQFKVQVFWTDGATAFETFFTSEKTFTLSHRYTPEELSGGGLRVQVYISDNEDFEQNTLQFREGAPVEFAPPKFESPPAASPPDRVPQSRPQPTSTTPQIASPDAGRAVSQGRQEEVAVQQFVLRVVGADGEESTSYPLPAEALANLPAFLTNLGVPDGHYRVYLVTGELERLVIDAHLRAGRIIDPRDESQPTFDSPPTSENQADVITGDRANGGPLADVVNGAVVFVAEVPIPEEKTDSTFEDGSHAAHPLVPFLGGAIVVGAAAAVSLAAVHTRKSPPPPTRT